MMGQLTLNNGELCIATIVKMSGHRGLPDLTCEYKDATESFKEYLKYFCQKTSRRLGKISFESTYDFIRASSHVAQECSAADLKKHGPDMMKHLDKAIKKRMLAQKFFKDRHHSEESGRHEYFIRVLIVCADTLEPAINDAQSKNETVAAVATPQSRKKASNSFAALRDDESCTSADESTQSRRVAHANAARATRLPRITEEEASDPDGLSKLFSLARVLSAFQRFASDWKKLDQQSRSFVELDDHLVAVIVFSNKHLRKLRQMEDRLLRSSDINLQVKYQTLAMFVMPTANRLFEAAPGKPNCNLFWCSVFVAALYNTYLGMALREPSELHQKMSRIVKHLDHRCNSVLAPYYSSELDISSRIDLLQLQIT